MSKCPGARLLVLAATCALALHGQGSLPRSLEIELPPGVASEKVFIRYCLIGSFGDHCTWILPKPGVPSYSISATHDGEPAAHIKAIVYVPGCKIETIDYVPSVWKEARYASVCDPLPLLTLSGVLTRADRLRERSVQLQAKYKAYWAQAFLGNTDGLVTTIPIGDPSVLADNHFQLSIPDLAQDPLAGAADHSGVLQVWANDVETGDLIALLMPADHNAGEKKTNLGGLDIEAKYPPDILFIACAASGQYVHDHLHFATRADPQDACDR